MRTLDHETPEYLRRIQLIMDIVNTTSMSERLDIVERYEEKILQGDKDVYIYCEDCAEASRLADLKRGRHGDFISCPKHRVEASFSWMRTIILLAIAAFVLLGMYYIMRIAEL